MFTDVNCQTYGLGVYKALNLAKNGRAIFCCCYISVPRAASLVSLAKLLKTKKNIGESQLSVTKPNQKQP